MCSVVRHPRKIAAHEAVDLIGSAGRRVKTANVVCISSSNVCRKKVEERMGSLPTKVCRRERLAIEGGSLSSVCCPHDVRDCEDLGGEECQRLKEQDER